MRTVPIWRATLPSKEKFALPPSLPTRPATCWSRFPLPRSSGNGGNGPREPFERFRDPRPVPGEILAVDVEEARLHAGGVELVGVLRFEDVGLVRKNDEGRCCVEDLFDRDL